MRLILFLLLSIFFVSCKNAKKIELEVITFQNIGESTIATRNFQEVGKPLKDICKGDDYGFSPFYVNRLDINKKVELDYLRNKSVDYTKIKAIERDYDKFFRDSVAFKILSEPTNTNFSIDNYLVNVLSKNNYFIFSTDENLEINNAKIFSSIKELRDSITRAICEKNITKVIVLYEPQVQQPPVSTDATSNQDTAIITTTKVAEINSSTELLKKTLFDISNPKLSFEQRLSKANEAMKNIFSKNLIVETYINNAGVASHLYDKGHGKEYLENLATESSIIDFKILAHKDSIPNVSYLQVIEIHKQ